MKQPEKDMALVSKVDETFYGRATFPYAYPPPVATIPSYPGDAPDLPRNARGGPSEALAARLHAKSEFTLAASSGDCPPISNGKAPAARRKKWLTSGHLGISFDV
jgi:hypothetical protein